MDSMTKDVIRSIASVGYKDLLSARILLSAKQSAEGTFFVHFPYTLKLGIQKNVILEVIKGIQVYLVYAFTPLNTIDMTKLIRRIIRKIDAGTICSNKLQRKGCPYDDFVRQ